MASTINKKDSHPSQYFAIYQNQVFNSVAWAFKSFIRCNKNLYYGNTIVMHPHLIRGRGYFSKNYIVIIIF